MKLKFDEVTLSGTGIATSAGDGVGGRLQLALLDPGTKRLLHVDIGLFLPKNADEPVQSL